MLPMMLPSAAHRPQSVRRLPTVHGTEQCTVTCDGPPEVITPKRQLVPRERISLRQERAAEGTRLRRRPGDRVSRLGVLGLTRAKNRIKALRTYRSEQGGPTAGVHHPICQSVNPRPSAAAAPWGSRWLWFVGSRRWACCARTYYRSPTTRGAEG